MNGSAELTEAAILGVYGGLCSQLDARLLWAKGKCGHSPTDGAVRVNTGIVWVLQAANVGESEISSGA